MAIKLYLIHFQGTDKSVFIMLVFWTINLHRKQDIYTHNWQLDSFITLSILFPTSILTRSFFVAYVSSSFSHTSNPSNVSGRQTSYTIKEDDAEQ